MKRPYYRIFFTCLEYNFERDVLLETKHVIVSIDNDIDEAAKMCRRINSNIRCIKDFEVVKDFAD